MALALLALLAGAAVWLALSTDWTRNRQPDVKPVPVRIDERRDRAKDERR